GRPCFHHSGCGNSLTSWFWNSGYQTANHRFRRGRPHTGGEVPMPRPVFFPQGQNEWLLGIGQRLRAEYDVVLAAPLPPRLAALVKQLENCAREQERSTSAMPALQEPLGTPRRCMD